jgi:hypothetical protein
MDSETLARIPTNDPNVPPTFCGVAEQIVLPRITFVESKVGALEREALSSIRQLERLAVLTEHHNDHLKRLDQAFVTGQQEARQYQRTTQEEIQRIYNRVESLDRSVADKFDAWDGKMESWGNKFDSHLNDMRLAVLEGGREAVEAEKRRIEAHKLTMEGQEKTMETASKMWRLVVLASAAVGSFVVVGTGIYAVLTNQAPAEAMISVLKAFVSHFNGG